MAGFNCINTIGLEIRIPSASSMSNTRACAAVFYCLNNSIPELFEKHFEKTSQKNATQNTEFSIKLPKVELAIGRKDF